MNSIEDPNIEAYRQAFETYRYFANLRFAALTAFLVITGALFAVALKHVGANRDKTKDDRARFKFLMFAGIVIAAIFWVRDWRVDELMKEFVHKAFALAVALHMSDVAQQIPPPTTAAYISFVDIWWAVYGGSIIAWLVAAWLKSRNKL